MIIERKEDTRSHYSSINQKIDVTDNRSNAQVSPSYAQRMYYQLQLVLIDGGGLDTRRIVALHRGH